MDVTALDPFGNVDIGFSGAVSVALVQAGTLVGTTTVNVASGMAAFANLAITTTGTYQLEASSSPALTTTTSTSILVDPHEYSRDTVQPGVGITSRPHRSSTTSPFGAAQSIS